MCLLKIIMYLHPSSTYIYISHKYVDRACEGSMTHFQGKSNNIVPSGPGPGLGCDKSWLRGWTWLNPGQLWCITHPAPRTIWKACDHSSTLRLWPRTELVSQTRCSVPRAGLGIQQHAQYTVCFHVGVDRKKKLNIKTEKKNYLNRLRNRSHVQANMSGIHTSNIHMYIATHSHTHNVSWGYFRPPK